MWRKFNRIFFRSIAILMALIIIFGITFYFAVQSYSFQTWLGKKASAYLSSELNTEININKIEIDFFKKVNLNNVLIKDLRRDTLFKGDIKLNINIIDYKHKNIDVNEISLNEVNAKLIKAKNKKTFNYQFLVDYFAGDTTSTTSQATWKFKIGKILLHDVNFVYKDENKNQPSINNINFDDIKITGLNAQIIDPFISGDSILANVKALSLKEKSGFEIQNLSTQFFLSSNNLLAEQLYLKTTNSKLKGKVHFKYKAWADYQDFVQSVHFNSNFDDSSSLNFKDVAYFASELNDFNESIAFSGIIKGTVSDFSLKKFKLKYRNNTQFNGNLSLSGLPDLANSFLHFDTKILSTNYFDLIKIPEYPFKNKTTLKIPAELEKLGTIAYKGKFDGLLKDFTTYGEFKTALGKVNSELSIQIADKAADLSYKGKISTQNFNLGTLLGLSDFNALSMNFSIKGKGLNINTINSEAVGTIDNINFHNYDYKKIKLNGTLNQKVFNGLFACLDTNANFDFNGSISFMNKVPEMYFISTINRLNLNKLHLTQLDSGEFSSQLFINITADNLDNLSGQINFDNSVYKTKTKAYKLNKLNIDLDQNNESKNIILKSAYFNSKISGQYKITNLPNEFENFLYTYYPSYFTKPKSTKVYNDDFKFDLEIKDFKTIHDLFLPSLMLSKGSKMNGDFNAANQKMNVEFKTNSLTYNTFEFKEFEIQLGQNQNAVLAEITSRKLQLGDSMKIENFKVDLNSLDKSANYAINWDNKKTPHSNGNIIGRLNFENKNISIFNDSIFVCINDSNWVMDKPSRINFNTNLIDVHPFKLSHNNQSLIVSGKLSENINDSLQIKANQIILSQFNPLLKLANLKAEGELNGYIYLAKPNNNFVIDGNLNLQKFKMNDNLIGELSVSSTYNTKNNYLNLHGFTSLGLQDEFGNQIKNISFNGNYYLDNRTESIDIDLKANPANIKLLNPLLTDILTIKNGYVTGDVKIHGSPQNLKLDGKLRLFNSEIKVDYTNVIYNMSGDIEIMPDQIRFSDLMMREKGTKAAPQGTVNGNIFHNNFKKIQIDYDINYKNMLVLNTTEKENKTFYGKIYSTGRAGIYGYLNNLTMQIFDTLTKNSKFIMPLDGPNEIEDDDFVHFVRKDTIIEKKDFNFGGFNLDLSIHATPSTSVQIILDKQNGDMLNAQGQGNLNLLINTLGKFEMTGEYIITNGDYLFTLEHVINKKFDIEAGSSIVWNGNPLNAEIDIATSYKQRASIAPLLNDVNSTDKSRFAVDCKLLLSGKLFSPNINFGFDFPTVDATSKARIASVLSDEAEMNRQVFSFLLFRNFVTPLVFNTNGGGVTAAAGSAAASTSSELLSNRISGFLNSYFGGLTGLKDLNLGLNYRPGSQTTKETVDLALSKQFLNNRISVDGNFGVNNNQTSSTGALIGDVNIDYKLTDDGRYRLTGFNRTNNVTQLATIGGPYTQGVGFFYRREFNSLKDFFERNKSTTVIKR